MKRVFAVLLSALFVIVFSGCVLARSEPTGTATVQQVDNSALWIMSGEWFDTCTPTVGHVRYDGMTITVTGYASPDVCGDSSRYQWRIVFDDLAPGDYTVRVQVVDDFGWAWRTEWPMRLGAERLYIPMMGGSK